MTVRTALQQGTELLNEGAIAAPRLTAEVLLAHALQRERVYLFSHPEAELDRIAWIHYGRYLHERLSGKPTQYITKRQEFYGRDFLVTPDVLIPRPETEGVVTAALERVRPGHRVLDVGTGSGAIAVTLALESRAEVLASDLSSGALEVACRNAQTLHASVSFFRADLIASVRRATLDMIVSNPPYVGLGERESLQKEVRDFEPHLALFAGTDGNEIYRRLIAEAERALRREGWLVMELGYRSLEAVTAMLGGPEWTSVSSEADLSGIPRVLVGQWNGPSST